MAAALALSLPLVFLLTKAEGTSAEASDQLLSEINELYLRINAAVDPAEKSPNPVGSCIQHVRCKEEAVAAADRISQRSRNAEGRYTAPCVRISAVSGEGARLLPDLSTETGSVGLSLVHCLLSALQSRHVPESQPCQYVIDEILELTFSGNILSGTLISGSIALGQELLLGPDSTGTFQPVLIKSLRCNQVPVQQIEAGQAATISVHVLQTSSETENPCSEDDGTGSSSEEQEPQSLIKSIRRELRDVSLNCGVRSRPSDPVTLEGTVLLDSALDSTTYRCFEAVLVLLGGQWPARGLISGKWPPIPQEDSETDSRSGGSFGDLNGGSHRLRSSSPFRAKKRHQGCYTAEVYCRGIRQSATIVSMEELDPTDTDVVELPRAVRAASAVACREEEAICVARIGFHFQLRPERLRTGSLIVLRDQTQGHLSGVGITTHVQKE